MSLEMINSRSSKKWGNSKKTWKEKGQTTSFSRVVLLASVTCHKYSYCDWYYSSISPATNRFEFRDTVHVLTSGRVSNFGMENMSQNYSGATRSSRGTRRSRLALQSWQARVIRSSSFAHFFNWRLVLVRSFKWSTVRLTVSSQPAVKLVEKVSRSPYLAIKLCRLPVVPLSSWQARGCWLAWYYY